MTKMTKEEFIQLTQPIVALVETMAKVRFGENSERYTAAMSLITEAQAKEDVGTLFECLNSVSWYVNALSYALEKKLEDEIFSQEDNK